MTTPVVTKDFEVFDSARYNTRKDKEDIALREFLRDSTYIEMMDDQYWETPPDSYFRLTKAYYPNGNIEAKGLYFNVAWGGFQKGVWYYFDEKGRLTESIDYDQPYKFTFEELLKLLQTEKIPVTRGPVLQSTGFHTEITRTNDRNVPVWKVRWQYSDDKIGIMLVDGLAGKILKREFVNYVNN